MKYKLLRFSLLSIFLVLCGVVNADSYKKVTSATDLADGSYLIVYEDGNLALNGGLTDKLDAVGNSIEVTIVDGSIESTETIDAASFTYDATAKTLKGAGSLFMGQTSDANGLASSAETSYENTISFDDGGNVNIVSGGAYLRYNSASNQTRFRYYKSTSYTNQKAIQLYKKVTTGGGDTPVDNRIATAVSLSDALDKDGVVGGTIELPSVVVNDVNGNPIEGATVTWESSNTNVATITSSINLMAAGTATITATYAGDESNYKGSSASFKVTVKAPPYTAFAALQENATSTSTPVTINFNGQKVVYVNGSNAYLEDNVFHGLLVYTKDHGLEVGQMLTGTMDCNLILYQGNAEITGFDKTNLTIGTTEIVPSERTIADISKYNQSTLVTLKSVTYSVGESDKLLSDGTNTIVFYDKFKTNVALEEGKAYDITGVVVLFNDKIEICPRTSDDVVAVQSEEPEQYVYRDFAVNLTNAEAIPTTSTSFGVKVAEDGTYTAVAADDATANFIVNANSFNGAQHGWVNCVFTVPVQGAVKIELGDCQYGGQNGTIVDAAGNSTEIKANASKACWDANAPHDKVVVAYYAGTEATTLTITYNGYCPFIAVTSIDPKDIPSEATLTFVMEDETVSGTLPVAQKVAKGGKVTIPANTTLYKEGFTLTAWTDAVVTYKIGDEVTLNDDMSLTPVFTENTVSFADRTAETTLVWQFGEKNGAGVLNAQGGKTILVTQATIGEAVIDVKMDIDASNGKVNNVGRGDEWAQCNDGTILTIPAYKGTAVSFNSYGEGTGTTIGGADAENKAATYAGTAETLDIVAKGMSYIASVTAVYPVPAADEEKFVDIKADFTNGSFFAKDESGTYGLKMNEDGSFTRVAADDATANAVISGKYHSDEHGLSNFSATVKVLGTVKISMGTCAWGGDVTVKNAEGETVATFNTNTGACYHADKENNIAFGYYKVNAPTTLTISGGSYTPYFAVEAISPELIPNDVKFIYDIANAGAEGIAPEAEVVAIGKDYTLPKNFTLYKEGATLTGWSDGTNTYAPGETIKAPEAVEITLTPVFTENEVKLADRTEPVTLKFDFMRQDGAPTVGFQNQTGIWVAQATIGDKVIDVKADFDTNNGGKFANGNWNDWAQLNSGTKFTVPSCKGATVSMEAYGDITTTTIDGQTDYTSGKTISYEIAGAAETVDVVIGDGSYYRYIQVVLPVVQSQEPVGPFENAAATIEWPFNDAAAVASYSAQPNGAFSTVAVNTGDLTITGVGSRSGDDLAAGISFIKVKPAGSTKAVQWVAKPAKGLTFTPTKVSMWIQRFATDAENGVTITAKVGEGEAITLGNYTAPRNNKNQNDDKFGKNSNWVNHVEIALTAEQQAALTSGEELTLSATVGVGNTKEGGFSDVVIEGIVNGTVADVNKYTLATAVTPDEGGSVSVYPVAEQYEEGSEVTLTATENFGYDFVNWTNSKAEEVSTEAKFKYTMNSDETLVANFKKVETYELALTVDGTNDYMVTVSPAPTMVDGKMMYEAGTAVQLTANQYEGLVTFTNWSDGETAASKLISMDGDIQLTALYAEADIIAGWDFYKAGGSGRKADFAAQDNDADALSLVNTETGETQGWLDKSTEAGGGYESFKGAAVNWRTGSKNGDVGNWHWQTKVNAEAFTDITVQFQMLYNYNAYQTYNAEYSLDGENWTKFGSITMTGAKAEASFNEKLPAEANNQKDLFIRMLADKTSKVDGTASANDGNTLAMFFITGSPKLVDDGKAPVLVSTVPANKATGASATGKIVLTFDERVKMADDVVAYINNTAINSEMQNPTKGVVSGKTITFEYKGLEYSTQYAFILAANTVADMTDNFIAEKIDIEFTTMNRPTVTKGLYDAVVENVDQLMAAIDAAKSRSDKNTRYRIFIKNGEYTIPLSNTMKTVNGYEVPECITFINTQNLSLIGESRDGVIITNGIDKNATFAGQYGTTSKYDGIGNSDVFQISGSDYYFQDLTIESGMDDATGRDLAVQDKATRTVYKNTGLRGYQDTWTSNNDNGLYYFEGGYVRGRTDYMCGKGDAFFNGVELRQIAGGYAAVPSKSIKYGYVYKDCVINGEGSGVDGNYTLGRPWGSGTPVALFIDTKMNVVPSAIGWNEMSGGWPKRFAEYNSTTSTGSVIDLSGRKKEFGNEGDKHANNPVLTAEEALEAGNLHNMFGEWDPTALTEQAPIPTNVTLTGSKLTWDDSNYALLWAVCKDGQVIGFTIEPSYTVTESGKYTVRAANEMGGLSEASAEATVATGIETVETVQPAADNSVYTLQGVRVDKARKGLYIINGRKVVVK